MKHKAVTPNQALGQVEPLCQISRQKVIIQTDTHTHPTECNTWTTELFDKHNRFVRDWLRARKPCDVLTGSAALTLDVRVTVSIRLTFDL